MFNEDVVRHYQQYLESRRAQRNSEEYRPVTPEEWGEFEEHFDKRKVELGTCGRPYGTPCAHEHACIRCPMLRVSPDMLDRLNELETDLHARRDIAQTKGWIGEVEGIALTLSFLARKRTDLERLSATKTTALGVPGVGAPA
ncbi:integrase [Gordonia terrae]|uniref:integrase n=1 Tax=Gordonia terrae TaxID=2055 RepID=UPI001930B7D7|nr:integrase [Gordonia terrae]